MINFYGKKKQVNKPNNSSKGAPPPPSPPGEISPLSENQLKLQRQQLRKSPNGSEIMLVKVYKELRRNLKRIRHN